MLMKEILTWVLVFVGKDVRIVTVDEDVGISTLLLQSLWQKVCRPINVVGSGCPGLLRMSIQTMYQDYIDIRLGMGVDGCKVETCNLSNVGFL